MSTFTNAMRYVGDLDDEFYDDERQRDVWNEASAIGFQIFVWASLIAGAVLPWVAGRTGSWMTVGLLVVYLTGAFSVMAYARSRGVDMYTTQKLGRPRIYAAAGLYLIGACGAIGTLVVGQIGNRPYFAVSMLAGGVLGLAGAVVGVSRKQRLEHKAKAHAEQAELAELQKEG
ncbi:hypothetical protein QMK17_21865 [Rhodococcus sp. G-MC3]|uniref:hypothetical protein n=1 Tax=Rhodococcus sp. G-MC3 TaxID=3046209 RepID=UPI0024BBC437|nr:hypothetical protein [Rhodococcus sp. G-MC3]MDJ0395971.1 hypothetical protein [Rhodococcus sp. G-MC3]